MPSLHLISPAEAPLRLGRLLANLRGFAYRRRNDPPWTMEFVSDAFRNITGYDPQRFFQNQSLSFAHLISSEDRSRVSFKIGEALISRHRTTVTYRITAAHQAKVVVEDRLVGIYDSEGAVIAIEGVIDFAPIYEAAPSPLEVLISGADSAHPATLHSAPIHEQA